LFSQSGLYSFISHSLLPRKKKDVGLHDTTWGLKIDSPAKSKTGKTEFTVAGILRDAELKII
jgi:hypothetical protein